MHHLIKFDLLWNYRASWIFKDHKLSFTKEYTILRKEAIFKKLTVSERLQIINTYSDKLFTTTDKRLHMYKFQ